VTGRYKYIPNAFARGAFNLASSEYVGDEMLRLLERALGKSTYDRYMFAQDPLAGGKTSGEIVIITYPEGRDRQSMGFKSIGSIQKLG